MITRDQLIRGPRKADDATLERPLDHLFACHRRIEDRLHVRDLSHIGPTLRRYMPGTSMFNISGQPAMSVPLAWSKSGLPLGMMFAARFGEEAMLFRLAAQLEQERPWRAKQPAICA